MVRRLLFLILFTVSTVFTFAQKRTEMFEQIDALKTELDSVKNEAAEARRNEKASLAKMESYEKQVADLQAANSTMMKSLTSFAEVSNKNSDNINKAMASLNEKERQLKVINETIASNDSTALVVLTNAKQTLGENANIGVANGMIVISASLTSLFGSDSGTTITPESASWIQKIANIMTANPEMALTIEGLSMTGNLQLPAQQAAAVSAALQKLAIAPERLSTLGKDGNLKEGVVLKIHPKFDAFYSLVREEMKRGN
ncbi:MAG: hypothetical protein ACFCUL_04330 [Flavobacteriaceae bacterium]